MKSGLEQLQGLVESFVAGGGRIEGPIYDRRLLASWRQELEESRASMAEERYEAIYKILHSGDPARGREVYVAFSTEGKVVGGLLADDFPGRAVRARYVELLGSSGEVRGTGAALLAASTQGCAEGWSLRLNATSESSYYQRLGMSKSSASFDTTHEWSASQMREVRAISVGLSPERPSQEV